MRAKNETGARWLPVPVADFGKWQALLLEESVGRTSAVLASLFDHL
jgi:hypothetical protein